MWSPVPDWQGAAFETLSGAPLSARPAPRAARASCEQHTLFPPPRPSSPPLPLCPGGRRRCWRRRRRLLRQWFLPWPAAGRRSTSASGPPHRRTAPSVSTTAHPSRLPATSVGACCHHLGSLPHPRPPSPDHRRLPLPSTSSHPRRLRAFLLPLYLYSHTRLRSRIRCATSAPGSYSRASAAAQLGRARHSVRNPASCAAHQLPGVR